MLTNRLLLLLLSLQLGEVFAVTSSGVPGKVDYCVTLHENDTCQYPEPLPCDSNCNTLQYFINNVNTTINNPENSNQNVSLYFISGNHAVKFTERVSITAPACLNMIGPNVTIRANRSCKDLTDVDCGLSFEGIPLLKIVNLELYDVSIKLIDAKLTLHNCQRLDQVLLNINNSNVNFTGKTTFANSFIFTIYAYNGSITLLGHIIFTNNTAVGGGAMYLRHSDLYIASGSTVFFNHNTALDHGGAIYLDASKIHIAPNASIEFANNTAYDKGGALYFVPGITLNQILSQVNPHKCFFHPWPEGGNSSATANIIFTNNSASSVGDHIYGASVDECEKESDHKIYKWNFTTVDNSTLNSSLVSSDPLRVCLCNKTNYSNGTNVYVPQCNKTYIRQRAYPGERLDIPVAVVGWDYDKAKTNGMVYPSTDSISKLEESSYPATSTEGKNCTSVTYTLNLPSSVDLSSLPDKNITFRLYLTTVNIIPTHKLFKTLNQTCDGLHNEPCHHSPFIYNFNMNTLCPPGFHLVSNKTCNCYVIDNNYSRPFHDCYIWNYTGYFSWKKRAWADTTNSTAEGNVIYAEYCPFNYCNTSSDSDQLINLSLPGNAKYQCAKGRIGKLCGQCVQGYSLAIGSSLCIECKDYKGLSLLIFFAAAGFLLVFFINVVNLTVTQGMINGLLYYGNIIWAYQSVYLPVPPDDRKYWYILRIFVAWVNFDFGIQTCFAKRFDAVAKTLLQYLFPVYLWIIAGIIIISARYSTKMTNLFGNRAVSVLATLLLLSSTKLLRTILDSLTPTNLIEVVSCDHKEDITHWVWSFDGTLDYLKGRHIPIFLFAAFFFIFLWLPYTLLLLLMQWIQRKSHLRLLKWAPRLTPVYDAYFAPLKNKRHYWFGVLLVARCMLLVIYMATYTICPRVNYVLLLITTAMLLMWGNYYRVYKSKYVQLSENFFFLQIIIIGAVSLFADNEAISYVVYASIILVLIAFCGLVTWNCVMLAKTCCLKGQKNRREYEHDSREPNSESHLIRKSSNARYRDSILNTVEMELTSTDTIN